MGVIRKDVVGALILKDGKILLAQRSCADLDGKWELPGGKVEPGESHQDAPIMGPILSATSCAFPPITCSI